MVVAAAAAAVAVAEAVVAVAVPVETAAAVAAVAAAAVAAVAEVVAIHLVRVGPFERLGLGVLFECLLHRAHPLNLQPQILYWIDCVRSVPTHVAPHLRLQRARKELERIQAFLPHPRRRRRRARRALYSPRRRLWSGAPLHAINQQA